MLIIRLQRVGRKNDPSFRIVVTQAQNAAKSGKFLEILGAYNPRKTAEKTILNTERIQYWIKTGAQVSPTIHNLLVSKKIIAGNTINVASRKLGKKAKAAVEAKVATEAKKKEEESKVEVEEKVAEEIESQPAEVPTETEIVAEESASTEEVPAEESESIKTPVE